MILGVLVAMVGMHVVLLSAVSETACTSKKCQGIEHAVCNNASSSPKCKCAEGYKEGAPNTSSCVKIIGAKCTTNATCTTTNNVYCHNRICTCNSGFGEKNNICVVTVSGTTCTASGSECSKIKNSRCANTKCACKDGFVMNLDVCSAESGATSMPTDLVIVVCILAIGQHLFW